MKRSARSQAFFVVIAVALSGFAFASYLQRPSGEPRVDSTPAPPCPAGFIDRVGETSRILARLRSTARGASLLRALRVQVRFCFGEIDVAGVDERGVLQLDRRADIAEQSARAGHLLHHLVDGMPFPSEIAADADCDAIVDAAMHEEAEAHAVEVHLRAALGLPPSRYEFERIYHQTPAAERVLLVYRYLLAHPDGAPHMDPLLTSYRRRCEAERAAASR